MNEGNRIVRGLDRCAIAYHTQNFIPHQVEPDARRFRFVEKVGRHRLAYIGAQLFPAIALREDVVRKAFGYESPVIFLCYAEYDFHKHNLAEFLYRVKLGVGLDAHGDYLEDYHEATRAP